MHRTTQVYISEQSNQVPGTIVVLTKLVYIANLSVKSFLGDKVQQHMVWLPQIFNMQLLLPPMLTIMGCRLCQKSM